MHMVCYTRACTNSVVRTARSARTHRPFGSMRPPGPQQRLASVVPALAGCCRGARHDADRYMQRSPGAPPRRRSHMRGQATPDPGGSAGPLRAKQPPGPGPAAPRAPVLHEQAGRGRVQQRGQQRGRRQHERRRVVQRAAGQQERVVGQVGRVADLAQAAQPAARLAQQRAEQLACADIRGYPLWERGPLGSSAAGLRALGAAARALRGAQQTFCWPGRARSPTCRRRASARIQAGCMRSQACPPRCQPIRSHAAPALALSRPPQSWRVSSTPTHGVG